MTVKTDSGGQSFVDVPTLLDEHVRVTLVTKPDVGYKVPRLRVQIRAAGGQLRPGPEVPLLSLPAFLKALNELADHAARGGQP
jgi:hypothetical protein